VLPADAGLIRARGARVINAKGASRRLSTQRKKDFILQQQQGNRSDALPSARCGR
jgi:hypothetical protein